jgi:hypothetical protein
MSDDIEFIPYEEAKKIIGNVIEEEHLRESNRRILTVYDLAGKEMCWFDAEEVIRELGMRTGKRELNEQELENEKLAAVEYIMRRIPAWVREG